MQLRILQNIGVQRGNAIDAEAVVDIDMRHAYAVVLVDDRHIRVVAFFVYARIQLADNRHELGNRLFHKGDRPFFQRLRQYGVVRVRACL